MYDFIPTATKAAAITAACRKDVLRDVLRCISKKIEQAADDGNYSVYYNYEDVGCVSEKMESDVVAILEERGYLCDDEGYICWGPPPDNGHRTDFLTGSDY